MTKRPDSWEDPPEDPPEDDDTNWVPCNHAPFHDGIIEDRDCDYWNNLK